MWLGSSTISIGKSRGEGGSFDPHRGNDVRGGGWRRWHRRWALSAAAHSEISLKALFLPCLGTFGFNYPCGSYELSLLLSARPFPGRENSVCSAKMQQDKIISFKSTCWLGGGRQGKGQRVKQNKSIAWRNDAMLLLPSGSNRNWVILGTNASKIQVTSTFDIRMCPL